VRWYSAAPVVEHVLLSDVAQVLIGLSRVSRVIEGALDPNGIIAPGKYGIA